MTRRLFFNLECTQPSSSGKRHGGGIYGEIVLRRIVARGLPVTAFYNSGKWLNPDMKAFAESAPTLTLVDCKDSSPAELFAQSGADVVFSPIYSARTAALTARRNISVVHGLRTIELNHDRYCTRYSASRTMREKLRYMACRFLPEVMRRRYKAELAQALKNEVVVVSGHTAAAVRVWFPEYAAREIPVFYSPSTVVAPTHRAVAAGEKYLLMVSANRWEKNTLRAVEAIEALYDSGQLEGVNVKMTGLDSLDGIRYRFRHPERFQALGYVDDDELGRLYDGAYALLYPSLNEGFGYPPLEAMSRGVPVAASAVCSIPEVCGDAVLYFNPYDRAEIAGRVLQLTDPDIRQRLMESGPERFEAVKKRQDADLDALIDFLYR